MEDLDIKTLLQEYNRLMQRLQEAGIIRSNNLVADYGEYLTSKMLDLTLMPSGNKDYDAIDKEGTKYQIKTRKGSRHKIASILPTDRTLEELKTCDFDFLLGMVFDNDWNVRLLLKIPREKIEPNKHKRIVINKDLIAKYGIMPKS
jgi:hypothetical protein